VSLDSAVRVSALTWRLFAQADTSVAGRRRLLQNELPGATKGLLADVALWAQPLPTAALVQFASTVPPVPTQLPPDLVAWFVPQVCSGTNPTLASSRHVR
jgi:hypothetical protein